MCTKYYLMFKPVELLYEHCKENNSTIQEMYDKFLNVLEKTSEIEKWKYIAANFVEEHLGNMNQSMETDLKTDIPYIYDERWKVVVRFFRLYHFFCTTPQVTLCHQNGTMLILM